MAKGNVMGGTNRVASHEFQKRITKTGMICNKCKEDKLKSDYGVNKSWCLACIRVYNNTRNKKGRYKLW